MAKISYAEAYSSQTNENNGKYPTINWFSLKDDHARAVVRFMEDSVETLDILTVHAVNFNNATLKANCIRDAHDPVEKCPLCARGDALIQKVYVKLLRYNEDQNGNVTISTEIWERPVGFIKELQNKITNYGPLKNNLFIVTRNGARGDTNTRYTVDFAPAPMYSPEKYPMIPDAFANFKLVGNKVLDKSYDELMYYVSHNNTFPAKENASQAAPAPTYAPNDYSNFPSEQDLQPSYAPSATPTVPPMPVQNPVTPNPAPAQPQANTMPWDNVPQQVQRPTRYY